MMTPEQQRAAFAETSVAVVAGAGTGKTQMLTERFMHHLGNGLSPLEIVAVTFTEKAAAELRSRIREKVTARLPDREDLVAELEAAQIGTIHALAARICREHFEEAGIPPDFTILDELLEPLWRFEQLEQAMVALKPELFERMPWSAMRSALLALLGDPLLAAEAFERSPKHWPLVVEEARQEALRELLAGPEWRQASNHLKTYSGRADDLRENQRCRALAAVFSLEAGEDVPAALAALDALNLRGGSAKKWPDGGFEAVKWSLTTVRDLTRDALKQGIVTLQLGSVDDELKGKLSVLREAFLAVRNPLAVAKRQARTLDFADLEVHALRALENSAVRSYYSRRWKAYLIDEFQDTNPVQARMLEHLTAGAVLTVVGDEKQSIYGFRRADVRVFRRFRLGIKATGGSLVELTRSFRTHAQLVGQLNHLFAPLLGSLYQSIEAAREETRLPGPYLRAYWVQTEGKTVNKAERRRTEAHHIAGLFRELLDSGAVASPGEMAVLTRTWDPLDLYGEALAAFGIPAVHAGGGDLLITREAKDAAALLAFLANPGDNLSLAAVLRSPFFAVDDLTLYQFVQSLPKDTAWWSVLADGPPAELERPVEVLNGLLRDRATRSLTCSCAVRTVNAATRQLPPTCPTAEGGWRTGERFLTWCRRSQAASVIVSRSPAACRTYLRPGLRSHALHLRL